MIGHYEHCWICHSTCEQHVLEKLVKVKDLTEEEYKQFDPFSHDRDVDVRLRRVKIVTTRTDHNCMSPSGNMHVISPGTRARYEEAIVDGGWSRYWTCLECIDLWFDFTEEDLKDDEPTTTLKDLLDPEVDTVYVGIETFNDYGGAVMPLAVYPNKGANFVYPTLGLTGEAGEVSDKIKKVLRDKNGELTEGDRIAILRELGDVLWYVAALASELGSSMGEVAQMNVDKLIDRNRRNKIHGDGDDR